MDSSVLNHQHQTSFHASRRRDVRIEAPGHLTVTVPTAKGPLGLRDISISGICLVAKGPLALKSVHRVTLTLGARTLTLPARTAYCRVGPAGTWLMGMEFIASGSPRQVFRIDDLVDELLAGSISFS